MSGVCGKEGWRVSLHGGHSSGYCDHAADPLADMLDAAVAAGMTVFGVTEHAPRVEEARLYDEERTLGWTVETLAALFSAYAAELDRLIPAYAGRLEVLKGFEAEMVPEDRYAVLTRGWRESLGFESPIVSDTAALHGLIAAMRASGAEIHVLRDPTRGGLATTLRNATTSFTCACSMKRMPPRTS